MGPGLKDHDKGERAIIYCILLSDLDFIQNVQLYSLPLQNFYMLCLESGCV